MLSLRRLLRPDDVERLPGSLASRCGKGCYTSVAEFHYLHHEPRRRSYQAPATMAYMPHRRRARCRHLLHASADGFCTHRFRGRRRHLQARFLLSVSRFSSFRQLSTRRRDICCAWVLRCIRRCARLRRTIVGGGGHVTSSKDTAATDSHPLADMEREVKDCIAWSGREPVDCLADHAEIDRQWCLLMPRI